MKVKDIITEEAHFAVDLKKFDSIYNPEIVQYHLGPEEKRTFQTFKGGVPVFKKATLAKPDEIFTTDPQPDEMQSPGYRGRESVKKRAGVEYDHKVQKRPSSFLPTQDPDFNKPQHNKYSI